MSISSDFLFSMHMVSHLSENNSVRSHHLVLCTSLISELIFRGNHGSTLTSHVNAWTDVLVSSLNDWLCYIYREFVTSLIFDSNTKACCFYLNVCSDGLFPTGKLYSSVRINCPVTVDSDADHLLQPVVSTSTSAAESATVASTSVQRRPTTGKTLFCWRNITNPNRSQIRQ